MSERLKVVASNRLIKKTAEVPQVRGKALDLALQSLGTTDEAMDTYTVRLDYRKPRHRNVLSDYDPRHNAISLYVGSIHAQRAMGSLLLGPNWLKATKKDAPPDIAMNTTSAIAGGALAYQARRLADHSIRVAMGPRPDEEPLLESISTMRKVWIFWASLAMAGGDAAGGALHGVGGEKVGAAIGFSVVAAAFLAAAAQLQHIHTQMNAEAAQSSDKAARDYSRGPEAFGMFGQVLDIRFKEAPLPTTIEQPFIDLTAPWALSPSGI